MLWKRSILLPIPKVNTPTNNNYFRSISILPILSNAQEQHIAHKQLTDFLHTHDLHEPYKSDFRTGLSTTTALLKVTEDIREALD